MDKDTAESIIKKVKEDYNTISEHFSLTRRKKWYEFYLFHQYLNDNTKILDLGCGNGRILPYLPNKNINYTGLDISEELLNRAKKFAQTRNGLAKYSFVRGDLTDLPFPPKSFDTIIAVASLYHIPSKELRKKAFQEVARVLNKNGIFIMTYWNMWESSRVGLIVKNILKKIMGQSQFDFFDAEKPWKNPQGEVMVKRYTHAFTLREATRFLQKLGFKIEKKIYTKEGQKAHFWNGYNGIVIARKI